MRPRIRPLRLKVPFPRGLVHRISARESCEVAPFILTWLAGATIWTEQRPP